MKKHISELTDEEIVDLAQNPETVSSENSDLQDNIQEFIQFYNLKEGTEKIHVKMLKKLYSHWDKNKTGYGGVYLTMKLQMFLPKQGSYFLLDIRAIDLSLKAKEAFFKNTVTRKFSNVYTKKHLDLFLLENGIKEGDFFIRNKLLYTLYKNWCKQKRKRVINSIDFNQFIKFFIKHDDYGFFIDKHSMIVTEEEIEKAKKEIEKHQKKDKKA